LDLVRYLCGQRPTFFDDSWINRQSMHARSVCPAST
jgi:hypothetical protein